MRIGAGGALELLTWLPRVCCSDDARAAGRKMIVKKPTHGAWRDGWRECQCVASAWAFWQCHALAFPMACVALRLACTHGCAGSTPAETDWYRSHPQRRALLPTPMQEKRTAGVCPDETCACESAARGATALPFALVCSCVYRCMHPVGACYVAYGTHAMRLRVT